MRSAPAANASTDRLTEDTLAYRQCDRSANYIHNFHENAVVQTMSTFWQDNDATDVTRPRATIAERWVTRYFLANSDCPRG